MGKKIEEVKVVGVEELLSLLAEVVETRHQEHDEHVEDRLYGKGPHPELRIIGEDEEELLEADISLASVDVETPPLARKLLADAGVIGEKPHGIWPFDEMEAVRHPWKEQEKLNDAQKAAISILEDLLETGDESLIAELKKMIDAAGSQKKASQHKIDAITGASTVEQRQKAMQE